MRATAASAPRLDFHLHTQASDGALSPREALAAARREGLAAISICDHDTVDAYGDEPSTRRPSEGWGGLPEGWREGRDPRVLPGVELSVGVDGQEIHILGYFASGFPPELCELIETLIDERTSRIRRSVERLQSRGVPLSWEEVLRETTGRVVGQWHLARALVRKRVVENLKAAFERVLGGGTPGTGIVEAPRCAASTAIRSIADGGGIAVWAHPSSQHIERYAAAFAAAGLRGVELFTPRRGRSDTERIAAQLPRLGLFATGGSDWHGHPGQTLGRFTVRPEQVEAFLAAVGW